MALAYVQAPIADRLERLGMNRTVAALLIVAVVVSRCRAAAAVHSAAAAAGHRRLISNIPGYVTRVQRVIVDPNLPWLSWLGAASRTRR